MRSVARPSQLIRGLGPLNATAVVVGVVIGTGVFLKAAIITQLVGSPLLALAAWAAAGVLSLAGALTYAELGAMLPQTGGEYVFLRRAYGDPVAFQFGWMRLIVGAGASAAVAASFAAFFMTLVPAGGPWIVVDTHVVGQALHWQFGPQQMIALAAIGALAAVNCIGVVAGGRTQTALAAIKVLAVLVIIVGVFAASRSGSWTHFAAPTGVAPSDVSSPSRPAAFGSAVIAALWAYTGWSYLPSAAGEMRDPGRNLPRAIIGGMLLVIVLYLAINTAYFFALPADAIVSANSTRFPTAPAVATKAVATFLSGRAGDAITLVFLVSALGTLNGSMLTTPRVPFAMARDGLFFPIFGVLGSRSRVPVVAIITQAVSAGILGVSGTYDQLTDLTVFSYAIFYVLTGVGLFVLRRKLPDLPRPYRTLGYPWLPLLFVAASSVLVVNMVRTNPVEGWLALALLACGVPGYLGFKRRFRATRSAEV